MPFIYFHRHFLLVANMSDNGPVFRYSPFRPNDVKAVITMGAVPYLEYPRNSFTPFDIAMGPDGWLYVLPLNANQVWRFNGVTGKYAGTLVHNVSPSAPARRASLASERARSRVPSLGRERLVP